MIGISLAQAHIAEKNDNTHRPMIVLLAFVVVQSPPGPQPEQDLGGQAGRDCFRYTRRRRRPFRSSNLAWKGDLACIGAYRGEIG